MSRQFFSETIAWSTADGVAVANTVTETIVMPNLVIPANYMQDGRLLRVKLQGKHSTTVAPTLIFRVRWGGVGGTVIGLTPTFTCGTTVTNYVFDMEFLIQVRANGSTGGVVLIGNATLNGATVPAQAFCVAGISAPATTTVDLTVDTSLSVTVQWGTASILNTLNGMNYTIEAMN